MLPLSHLLYAFFMTAWLCPYVLDVINQESYNALGGDTYCSLFSQKDKEESGLPLWLSIPISVLFVDIGSQAPIYGDGPKRGRLWMTKSVIWNLSTYKESLFAMRYNFFLVVHPNHHLDVMDINMRVMCHTFASLIISSRSILINKAQCTFSIETYKWIDGIPTASFLIVAVH